MEETIKISFLGQEITLTKQSIANLQPIITQATLKQIRLPLVIKYFQPELDVLHSCLYYLIAIEKNLSQSHQLVFRQKCLSNLSQYYIKRNMNFELYEYGLLCSKILSIPLDKSMHIIYFLVYTRLASKPFINNIITKMENKASQLSRKQIIKSQKQFSIQSKVKSNESRHLTIFCDSNQIESQILKKQLHKIMNPKQSKKMTRKVDNKRYFNLKKVYQDNNDLKQQKLIEPVHYQSANSSRVVSIPVKVCNKENSSVITRLKLISGVNQEDNHFKKIQVRRQKFNQWFGSTAKYEQIKSQTETKQNKKPQWGTLKNILEKESRNLVALTYKNQKHPYEYYQNIASSIRNKNDQLDSIRYQCFHHDDKSIVNSLKQPISHNYFQKMLNKHSLKTESSKIELTSENYKNIQTNREVIKEDYKQDYFIEKDYGKLSKTTSLNKSSQLQDHGSTITRKNDAFSNEDETAMLFNKKIKNKFKLQKYKHQYRHFLKTQVFERVKNSQ